MTSANLFCRLLIETAVAHGVKTAVCSPGSRNTPLLLAAEGCEELTTRIVVDERTAAFVALGEAMVSQCPVMLICTSGTALLNYAPAVAEAYYAGIPLIVVSADRPVEWIDQDDSQTLKQYEALAHFVKNSYDMPVYRDDLGKRGEALTWYIERCANDAMITALKPKRGPVHINIQLDVPLGAVSPSVYPPARFIETISGPGDLSREQIYELAEEAAGRKVLLICGFAAPSNILRESVAGIASKCPNVAVMAETVANVGAGGILRFNMIDSLLSALSEKELELIRPDLVISIGGALISRQVKDWLRTHKPEIHWSVGFNHTTIDCLKSLTARIETDPGRFLRQLTFALKKVAGKATLESESGSIIAKSAKYGEQIRNFRIKAAQRFNAYVINAPWSDLKAFGIIRANFPKSANLFLSNGTAIRYDQLFAIPSHATFCNRGVSGIDGCTSTAVGGALAYSASLPEYSSEKRPTVLITGDMSFSYDLGALGCGLAPDTLKIIVLNNGGGNIFRFIGSTSGLPQPVLEKCFCADPMLDIRKVAIAFGFDYLCCRSADELQSRLPDFFSSPTASVLEIKTDGTVSTQILKEILTPEKGYIK